MKSKGKLLALVAGGLALFLIPVTGKKREGTTMIDQPPATDFRNRILAAAESQIGQPNLIEYSANALGLDPVTAKAQGTDTLSWCGFFGTWALQQAGASVNWVLGKGVAYQLQRTNEPEPGDIAYIDQPYQHHAIVKSVDGDIITTIDGNSTGGKVAINKRPKSEFDAFYSVASLDPNTIAV